MNMRLPGDPSLPGGCTARDIDRHMGGDIGYEECSDCDGRGHTGSECCGEDVGDDGICPKCKGHADNESCSTCDGTGEVEYDIEERRQEARDEARISAWEDRDRD